MIKAASLILLFSQITYAEDMFDSAMKIGIGGFTGSVVNAKEAVKQSKQCAAASKTSCLLAVLHGAQAASSATKSINSFKVADGIKPDGYQMPPYAQNAINQNKPKSLYPNLTSTKQTLEDMGYKYDSKSQEITTPSGNSITSLSNKNQLKENGYNSSEFDKLQIEMKKAQEKVKKEYNSKYAKEITKHQTKIASTKPTSINQNKQANEAEFPDFSKYFSQPTTQTKKTKASVTGLSVIHGNEKVGVSGDNIFEMVGRQYSDRAVNF